MTCSFVAVKSPLAIHIFNKKISVFNRTEPNSKFKSAESHNYNNSICNIAVVNATAINNRNKIFTVSEFVVRSNF